MLEITTVSSSSLSVLFSSRFFNTKEGGKDVLIRFKCVPYTKQPFREREREGEGKILFQRKVRECCWVPRPRSHKKTDWFCERRTAWYAKSQESRRQLLLSNRVRMYLYVCMEDREGKCRCGAFFFASWWFVPGVMSSIFRSRAAIDVVVLWYESSLRKMKYVTQRHANESGFVSSSFPQFSKRHARQ